MNNQEIKYRGITFNAWAIIAAAGLCIIALASGFLYLDYTRTIEQSKKEVTRLLEGISKTTATSINPSSFEQLFLANKYKDDIRNSNQDSVYRSIHLLLKEVKVVNHLAADIVTIARSSASDMNAIYHVATSEVAPRFRHQFYAFSINYSNYKKGAAFVFNSNKKDNLAIAITPMLNSSGRVVGAVLIREPLEKFIVAAQSRFWSQASYTILILFLVFVPVLWLFWRVLHTLGVRSRYLKEDYAKLHESYNSISSFVEGISRGDLEVNFNGSMDHTDQLMRSLLTMRDGLLVNHKKEEERNWISEGKEVISRLLQSYTETEALATEVLSKMVEYIDVVQGAFYIAIESGDTYKLKMIASHAYNRKKHIRGEFDLGQGLVGEAALEKRIIYRTDIPEDYVTIKSGLLGVTKPSSLLIVPLIANETVHGAIELASLGTFSQEQIKIVEELGELIAISLGNLKATDKIRNSHNRTHALLENASEVISIFDETTKVIYESPSVTNILGYEPTEVIGDAGFPKVHPKGRTDLKDMFEKLMQNPDRSYSVDYSYEKKDGERIWLNAVGSNLLNDPAINGIILNSRDITQNRRAEKEQVMRGKMQALSENSQDLIVRIDLEGEFLYANPIISQYSGVTHEEVVGKKLKEVELTEAMAECLREIGLEVQATNEPVERELAFTNHSNEEKIVMVKAIPEFDGVKLDTILIVSHDVTESKLIEREIKEKNKSITESINYAESIQSSILPSTELIKSSFDESFIFYRPKDVVSGDFPWFAKRGDDIYIAVVDCTGHGVPGAMMSFVGYFLMNEITGHSQILPPSTVLERLHDGVVKTLRQDAEDTRNARDGMDVALCKINLKTNTLEYSGAHRPLYMLRKGELIQYKGTRRSIGGGQSMKMRRVKSVKESGKDVERPFVNYQINIEEDDAFFFFSDGLPDQFGGPEGLKYGPKRIRETIEAKGAGSMQKVQKIFEDDFSKWKNGANQIDDVLMIGIRPKVKVRR